MTGPQFGEVAAYAMSHNADMAARLIASRVAEQQSQQQGAPSVAGESLPQRLRHLFGSGLHVEWDELPAEDRAYWEQQSAAVLGAVTPEPAPAPVLPGPERQLLTFALNLAYNRMCSEDGFTAADEAALASLRKLAGGER